MKWVLSFVAVDVAEKRVYRSFSFMPNREIDASQNMKISPPRNEKGCREGQIKVK